MREIKFRGFDLDLKKWFYGGYYKYIKRQVSPIGDELKENDIQHLIIMSGFADWNMPRPIQVVTNIDPKSIGEYTGIKDKNGVEIYEGDIVKVIDKTGIIGADIGEIIYMDCLFSFESKNFYLKLYKDLQNIYEVIGNIYENPELLEK